MAIKGKGKSKQRSGRVVTAGPRPAYVPPKVPLFQRTGAKFLVVLIIETLFFALIVGFGEQSEGDRQKKTIEEVTSLVESSLSTAGSAIQPLPTGAIVLPELGTRLGELTGEEPPEAEAVAAETEGWAAAVTRAADGIAGIQVPEEDLEPGQRLALTEGRNLIERGLRLYADLAKQVGVAAAVEGDPQADLIATLQDQLQIVGGLFNAGYGKIQEARRSVGLSTSSTLPGAGGVPPAGVPGGLPGLPGSVTGEQPVEIPAETGGGGGGNGGGNGGGGQG